MNDHSKIPEGKCIVNGNNHIVNIREALEEYIKKGYNAECGSGFYCIKDMDIAKKYAYRAATEWGGRPTLNFYHLNHTLIRRDLKVAYFNSVESQETLDYLGGNITGNFPSFCKVEAEDRSGKRPADLCYVYPHSCPWSADYIEAVLSDATYNLDDVFVAYWNKQASFHDTIETIYEKIDEANDSLRFQVVLRGKILDIEHFNYLVYDSSLELKNE